jgi:DNA-binding NarL/FixJ family response regulator
MLARMLDVLIVDDSPEIQRRLSSGLDSLPGVRVVGCAAGADQALALARALHPDVVVLDVALRDGDRGYGVMRRLAHDCPQARVIVLSNFGWGAMREGFLQGGASAYFDKAFEFRKAVDWIAAHAASGTPGPDAGRAAR